MKSFPCCIVPACAIALCCGTDRSHAQALEFGIGMYAGVTDNATNFNSGSSQWRVAWTIAILHFAIFQKSS
jgi:hypothetical protein